MNLRNIILFIFILFLISFGGGIFAQCPMCKASLESARTNGTQVGTSLNNGILYLLALPYSITAVFGFIMFRRYKEQKKQQSSN